MNQTQAMTLDAHNPFQSDDLFESQELFPAFKLMIDMAADCVVEDMECEGGEWIEKAYDSALEGHRVTFNQDPFHSKEKYANQFIISFFLGELPTMDSNVFRVYLAALQEFIGENPTCNV